MYKDENNYSNFKAIIFRVYTTLWFMGKYFILDLLGNVWTMHSHLNLLRVKQNFYI